MGPKRAAFLVGWLVAALLLPWSVLPASPNDDGTLASLEIPLEGDAPTVRSVSGDVRDTLAGLRLTPPPAVKAGETHPFVASDGRYVLAGDLFGEANQYALVDLQPGAEDAPGIALAVWQDGHWELRGLWKIRSEWRPAGWEKSDDDSLPVTPATQPFWLEHLAGDSAPWVVFAGETSKYFQFHDVLRFDAAERRLRLLGEAMDKPEFLPGGWLRLYYNSGHRAIFEEWDYQRWDGKALTPCADWHNETPYNDPDSPFVEATVYGRQGGAPHTFKAERSDRTGPDPPGYRISHDGQPFASVTFLRRHPLARSRRARLPSKKRICLHGSPACRDGSTRKTTPMEKSFPTGNPAFRWNISCGCASGATRWPSGSWRHRFPGVVFDPRRRAGRV